MGITFAGDMNRDQLRGHCAIFGANFIWGAMSPIVKFVFACEFITPLMLVNFRVVGAALLFWLLTPLFGNERVPWRDRWLFFGAALLGVVFNQGVYTIGLDLTSPVDASVISTSTPIFTMVLAAIFLREPLSVKKVGGVLLGATGAVTLILSGASGGLGGNALGDVLCLVAELSFAFYLVLFKGLISRYSPFTVMKWMFTWSALCIVPVTLPEVCGLEFGAVPMMVWLALGFAVVFATFVAYLLAPIGQRSLRPTVVSIYFYTQPVVSAVLAAVMGTAGEFGWLKIVSIALIFIGVGLVMKSKARGQDIGVGGGVSQ